MALPNRSSLPCRRGLCPPIGSRSVHRTLTWNLPPHCLQPPYLRPCQPPCCTARGPEAAAVGTLTPGGLAASVYSSAPRALVPDLQAAAEVSSAKQKCFQGMIKKTSIYNHPLVHRLMDAEAQKENRGGDDKKVVAEIMARCFVPASITAPSWEGFHFAGQEIRIREAMDCYGAVVWPSALVLCYFLETNVKQYNMVDKNVIEIGAGTGLVSIVASLLGAHVTATDLPELLGNLQYNISRNTKMKCKHLPQVKELSWGIALDKNFPRSSSNFDYILAADVVYAHPFLEELLITFDHLCKETTVILWVMKFRLEKENKFVDRFKELFDLEEISSFPSLNIKLYKAVRKNRRNA
ncbi:putative methyltransferase-like protein 21E [Camelus dromedarius]|uniref:putative methyltransferase-like protein 21E n=1 Tax=Camelus dromedarius TaxID=9838 RepID=UPI00057BBFD3